jgi:transcriptional regulator with XRE-family HTH domain
MGVATIGSALVEKRLELGLDKGQAADVIGMSRTTYSSYEQDSQRPSVEVFPALAEFLGISTEVLLTLYGATCVAAARASLERVVSHQGEASEGTVSSEKSRSIIDATSRESAVPSEELTAQRERPSIVSVVNSQALETEELHEPLVLPDVRADESVSRHREASAQDSAIVTSTDNEWSLAAAAYGPKKKSENKKKKKKKQKIRRK